MLFLDIHMWVSSENPKIFMNNAYVDLFKHVISYHPFGSRVNIKKFSTPTITTKFPGNNKQLLYFICHQK